MSVTVSAYLDRSSCWPTVPWTSRSIGIGAICRSTHHQPSQSQAVFSLFPACVLRAVGRGGSVNRSQFFGPHSRSAMLSVSSFPCLIKIQLFQSGSLPNFDGTFCMSLPVEYPTLRRSLPGTQAACNQPLVSHWANHSLSGSWYIESPGLTPGVTSFAGVASNDHSHKKNALS